jgi:hypothetical protein
MTLNIISIIIGLKAIKLIDSVEAIEGKLRDGVLLTHEALAYAVEELGLNLMDIRFYPVSDSWGF